MNNNVNHRTHARSLSSRGRCRPKGLPEHLDLIAFASTYLTEQQQYYPDLVGTAILPAFSDAAAIALADEFEMRFQLADYRPEPVRVVNTQFKEIGAAYVRYSDANSNTRSLDQQLINILKTAHDEGIFVPFRFVFADAAISGMTAARPGYQLLLKAVEAPRCITVVLVDELDRLSRTRLTSLEFEEQIEKHQKRLLNCHGYDSSDDNAAITMTITSLQSTLHIGQLKLKVDRGMTYSVKQGNHVNAPPLGYRLEALLDAFGQPVLGPNRRAKFQRVIDTEGAAVVKRIFEMYSSSKMSPTAIARQLNDESVLGKTTWNTSGISTLLTHDLYIGISTWKRTRNSIDKKNGQRRTTKRPKGEQLHTEVPHLRIITDELWDAVQKRKKEVSRNAYSPGKSKGSRQSQYPTRLFDTYCDCCDKPLRLYKAGKYAQLECPCRSDGKLGCSLTVSKSLRTIDECILAELSQQLLDEETIAAMVTSANEFLAQEASRPTVDVKAIEKKIRETTAKIGRMASRLADLDSEAATDVISRKIAEQQQRLDELKSANALASEQNFNPEPLTLVSLQYLIADLRDLLHEDVVAAHEVLAKALGPVYVRIGPKRGKRLSWIAELNIDPLPVMVEIAGRKNCPSTPTLEFLRVRSWTMSRTVKTELRHWGNAERYAKTVGTMLAAGSAHNTIAVALGIDPVSVDAAAAHFAAGTTCNIPPRDYCHRRSLPASKVDRIAADVVRMKDVEGLSFREIAVKLKASQGLVSKSYKQAKGDQTLKAAKEGKQLKIAPSLRLPKEKHDRIRELLHRKELSYRAIAREVGCGHHSVSAADKRMNESCNS
jgi:DNA invertase Pin-like site-specific DNA recombinase